MVKHGAVQTRPLSRDILAGITRHALLDVAEAHRINVTQRAFMLDQALAADELFLTSATSFVLPVTQVDDHTIGNGKPGPITTALRNGYIDRARTLTA
jgi:D-alanine transaminase